jgi:hypothetical protein
MMTRTRALALAALLLAAPSRASIPSNLDGRARAGLLHVCIDVEPGTLGYQACSEQAGGGVDPEAEYTGAECVLISLPPACTIDFLPKPKIKGKVMLVEDDAAFDTFGSSRVETAVLLELKIGSRKHTLIELFDGSQIGFWNDFDEAFVVDVLQNVGFTNLAETAYNFAGSPNPLLADNLGELALEIRELAQAAFPAVDLSEALPVLTAIAREKAAPVDRSADGLASAARFKIEIRFARARP